MTGSSSKSSSSKSQKRSSDHPTDAAQRHEQQRLRNIQSAKRSRDRLKHEDKWMEVQASENADRIRKLEQKVTSLSQELLSTASRKPTRPTASSYSTNNNLSRTEERPSWFGQPF